MIVNALLAVGKILYFTFYYTDFISWHTHLYCTIFANMVAIFRDLQRLFSEYQSKIIYIYKTGTENDAVWTSKDHHVKTAHRPSLAFFSESRDC